MAVIGIDLDETLALKQPVYDCEVPGEPDPKALQMVWELHLEGAHTLCLWTTRPGYIAERWLRKHGIRQAFNYINESPYPSESGKASFDLYIGNEALRWPAEMETIRALAKTHYDEPRDKVFADRNPKPWYQGTGRAFIDHTEELWKELWQGREALGPIAFLTICSHSKPYSKSHIHSSIRKDMWEHDVLPDVDYIHLSNVGVIPQSSESVYPFNAYDWNNAEITEDGVREYLADSLYRRFAYWLDKWGKNYASRVIYLRAGSGTAAAVGRVLERKQPAQTSLIVADQLGGLPYANDPDPDDCLIHPANLAVLIRKLKEQVF